MKNLRLEFNLLMALLPILITIARIQIRLKQIKNEAIKRILTLIVNIFLTIYILNIRRLIYRTINNS